MPELPDLVIYQEALERHLAGETLAGVRLGNPFLLRTVEPPLEEAAGRRIVAIRRLGKRLVLALEGGLFLILHLMIAGRLHWRAPGAVLQRRHGLAAFDTGAGSLLLTEAGSRRRASLHVACGEEGLAAHDPGGLEVLGASAAAFAAALSASRHTLKRALTDPRILSGIGNAYSDEILHRARLSLFQLTSNLDAAAMERLRLACVSVLEEWTVTLRQQTGEGFPTRVTAFRPGMAVHGRHRQPCPDCGQPVQRVVYAENEANYCAACQTGGRLLADRALSRLLRDDWPRTLDELEALRRR